MIDKSTVQRIKDTANIVDVVSDYVHLVRRGSNYMGLCPFHNERTPSFSVNPRRNICHCFSCGKGGSPVNFLMEKEGISYYDALKQLAKKYGIKVEERELTPEERKLATEREGLLIAAEAAMKQMEKDLTDTEEGRAIGLSYLYGRGVTDEAIKAFHLGYAIDKGDYLTPLMLRQGFDIEDLKKLGLAGESRSGGYYDKYRGRVIFPIMNSSGKVVGFGGRDLKGGPAKYINSPESVLYRKNNELYGIYQAKNEIVRQGHCFLVEGYLDVISMWQSGLKNVVASSGTALTDGQIAMIHRFAPKITLLYDGDAAGIKAALRGIDMLLSHKLKVDVLLLPDGHDPDSFARSHTPEEFRDYVEKHSCDIIRFKIDVLMKDAGDDPQKKAAVTNSVVESIACMPESVDRTIYIGECARIMKIDEGVIAAAVERARFKIVEQQRQDRRRREAAANYPDEKSQDPAATQTEVTEENEDSNRSIEKQFERIAANKRNPMQPLEKRMIELLIKYGYLEFKTEDSETEDFTEDSVNEKDPEDESGVEDGSEAAYFLIDFVADELAADNVTFSDPVYKKIFDVLLENLETFPDAYSHKREALMAEAETRLREGRDAIAQKAATLADIEREEKKLNDILQSDIQSGLRDFARFYPGDILTSHEDSEVRKVSTEVISEKYVLSNIFLKGGSSVDEDEISLINRALIEWKSELLNQMILKNMEELRLLSIALDENDFSNVSTPDAESSLNLMVELQSKISAMMTLRSQVAKNIGDRILSTTGK